MKRFAILSAIVAVGLGTSVVVAQGPGLPPPGEIEQVKDNLYRIPGAGPNTLVFVREDGVALVDTKLPNNGQAILDQVRKVTDKPIRFVINTHSHPDHVGSNAFFKEADPTVEVVSHRNTIPRLSGGPFANPANLPDISYSKQLTLGRDKDRIDLYYFGPGHTDNDSIIVFPALRAMAIGDLMAWNMGAVIDTQSGGSALALPETLTKAAEGIKDVDIVVEGHHEVTDWAGFLGYIGYTKKIVEVAKKGVAEGMNYVEAYDAYFATDPAMARYTSEAITPGIEYGGSPKSRTLNNLYVAMAQLRGEDVGTVMGAPPPPGN